MNIHEKNRRVGLTLAFLVLALSVYSLVVIRTRGRLPEPEKITKIQKILGGL